MQILRQIFLNATLCVMRWKYIFVFCNSITIIENEIDRLYGRKRVPNVGRNSLNNRNDEN